MNGKTIRKIIVLTGILGIIAFAYSSSKKNVATNAEPVATVLSTNYINFSFSKIALSPPPSSFNLDVPLINQNPELYNGCEITSLTMLLNFKDVKVDKMTLSDEMPKDETNLVKDDDGNILIWGNPEKGFVGDVSGNNGSGYAVNPKPLIPLVDHYYENGALDLTNTSLANIELSILKNNPVVAWVTADMTIPYNFQTWKDSNGNNVKATLNSHAVLLTGFDEKYIYYNDPLSSLKNAYISKEDFLDVWEAMGKRALSVN